MAPDNNVVTNGALQERSPAVAFNTGKPNAPTTLWNFRKKAHLSALMAALEQKCEGNVPLLAVNRMRQILAAPSEKATFEELEAVVSRLSSSEFRPHKNVDIKPLLTMLKAAKSLAARDSYLATIKNEIAASHLETRELKVKLSALGKVANVLKLNVSGSCAQVQQSYPDSNIFWYRRVRTEFGVGAGSSASEVSNNPLPKWMPKVSFKAMGKFSFSPYYAGYTFHTVEQFQDFLITHPKHLKRRLSQLAMQPLSRAKFNAYSNLARNHQAAMGAREQAAEVLTKLTGEGNPAEFRVPGLDARHFHGADTLKVTGARSAVGEAGLNLGVLGGSASVGKAWQRQTQVEPETLAAAFNREENREKLLGKAAYTQFQADRELNNRLTSTNPRIETAHPIGSMKRSVKPEHTCLAAIPEKAAIPEESGDTGLVSRRFVEKRIGVLEKRLSDHETQLTLYQNALYQHLSSRSKLHFALKTPLAPIWRNQEQKIAHDTKREIENKYGTRGRVDTMRAMTLAFAKDCSLLKELTSSKGSGLTAGPRAETIDKRATHFQDKISNWHFRTGYFRKVDRQLFAPRYTIDADVQTSRSAANLSLDLMGTKLSFEVSYGYKLKNQRQGSAHEGRYDIDLLSISFTAQSFSTLAKITPTEIAAGLPALLVQNLRGRFGGENSFKNSEDDSAGAIINALHIARELAVRRRDSKLPLTNDSSFLLEISNVDSPHDRSKGQHDWYTAETRGKKDDGKNYKQCYYRLYETNGLRGGGSAPVYTDGVNTASVGGELALSETTTIYEMPCPDTIEFYYICLQGAAVENPYLAWYRLYYQQNGTFSGAACPNFDPRWKKIGPDEARKHLPYLSVKKPAAVSKLWNSIGFIEKASEQQVNGYTDDQRKLEKELPDHAKGTDLYNINEKTRQKFTQEAGAVYVLAAGYNDVRNESAALFRSLDEQLRQPNPEPAVKDTNLLRTLFGNGDLPVTECIDRFRTSLEPHLEKIQGYDYRPGSQLTRFVRYEAVRDSANRLIVQDGRVVAKRIVEHRSMGYFERLYWTVANAPKGANTPEAQLNALYFLVLAQAISTKAPPSGILGVFGA